MSSRTAELSSKKESRPGLQYPEGSPPLSVSVRRGVLWSALSTLLLRLTNVAITAVVAHILAPRDFGIFTVALIAYTVIYNISEFGIGSCLIRADLDINVMAPTMFTVSLLTSAIFGDAMAFFARPIATALGSADGTQAVRVMALSVLISGFSALPGAQLTRDFKQDKLFLANVISLVPSTVALLILAKSGSGALAFAWSRVIAAAVMCLVMVVSAPKYYLPGLSGRALSVLFRFGLPLAGANFVNFVLINVDYVFVGHLLGPVALGAYMLAFTIASSPGLLLGNVINSISMPAFSRVKQDPERLKSAITSSLRMLSLILMPMCGLMIALSRPLVLTIYGAKWAASAEVLAILSFYGAISIICILFSNILTSLGKAKFTLAVQVLWLGALVPAMVIGVHRNGIIGAAVAHIVVIGPLILPSFLFALKRTTGIRLTRMGKTILPSVLAGVAAAVAARITADQFSGPLPQLVAGLAAGSVTYVVAAAPQVVAWLSHTEAARRRAPGLFRRYDASVAAIRRVAGGGHEHPGGTYRETRATAATEERRPTAGGHALPTASQGAGGSHSRQDLVTGRTTGLLYPEARVVAFWARPELGELLAWCRAPGRAAARLVTGEGGAGKTRLAIELARELENDGWQAQWVPPGKEPDAIQMARRTSRPTVLLLDDAETRTDVTRLLTDAAGGLDGTDLRVILLARNTGEWWHDLIIRVGYRASDMLVGASPIQLGPIADAATQREIFDAAIAGFAVRLGVTRPTARLAPSHSPRLVLAVHAAALSAVLDHIESAAGGSPLYGDDALWNLLRRELRYCAQAAAARGLGLDPGAQRRAIAAACLIGADSESAAVDLLRRLPDFAGSAERRDRAARWLHDLYPGPATDGRATGWLGSLHPDRMAEELIVSELSGQPDLIPALFTGLDEPRAKKALTVLGRAALSYPDAVPLLARALASDLEHLAVPALAVAVETNPVTDKLVANAIAGQAIPVDVLERIAAVAPRRSLAVTKTSVTVLSRLADGSSHGGDRSRRIVN